MQARKTESPTIDAASGNDKPSGISQNNVVGDEPPDTDDGIVGDEPPDTDDGAIGEGPANTDNRPVPSPEMAPSATTADSSHIR